MHTFRFNKNGGPLELTIWPKDRKEVDLAASRSGIFIIDQTTSRDPVFGTSFYREDDHDIHIVGGIQSGEETIMASIKQDGEPLKSDSGEEVDEAVEIVGPAISPGTEPRGILEMIAS